MPKTADTKKRRQSLSFKDFAVRKNVENVQEEN